MEKNLFHPITITAALVATGLNNNSFSHGSTAVHSRTFNYYGSFSHPTTIDPVLDIFRRIDSFRILQNNWDGYGADELNEKVLLNSKKLIEKLPFIIVSNLRVDDITPTPYGTIVIDVKRELNLISIEIGNSKIGFFFRV